MAATPKHAGRVLGLDETATLEDVKRVRREMAFVYHPDRSTGNDRSTRHMARINAAADTLIAHIKKTARAPQKGKTPSFTDFSAPKPTTASRAQGKPAQAETVSSTFKAYPCRAQQSSNARVQSRNQTARGPSRTSTAQADVDLVQYASASYRSVLDQIGSKPNTPSLNVKIMKYQSGS